MSKFVAKTNFVSIDNAPEQLKGLPPLRKARAMALLEGLPDCGFSRCHWPCSEPTPDLDQAIEDLLVAGLIELGAEDGYMAIRLRPTQPDAAEAQKAAE